MLFVRAFPTMSIAVLAVFATAEGASLAEVPAPRFQISEAELTQCREALRATVEVLQIVSIEFTAGFTYAVPNLPRVTGEKGFIHLDEGRMFYRFDRTFPPLPGRSHVEELEEVAYDGNTYYLGKRSKGGSPSIKTMLGDNVDSPHAWQHFTKTCPYLEMAGFQLPRKVAQWKGGKVTSVVLEYLSQGQVTHAAIDTDDGRTLIIKVTVPDPIVFDAQKTDLDLLAAEMRQNKSDSAEINKAIATVKQQRTSGRQRMIEMRLNSKENYCLVRRIESTMDGKLICDIEGKDFEQVPMPGVWLPKSGTIKDYVRDISTVESFTKEPNQITTARLQSVSFERRKDVLFVLDYGTGTMIVDRSSEASRSSASGEVTYIAPASPEELRNAAGRSGGRQWLLIANIVLLLLLVWMIIRGRRLSRRGQ